MRVDHWIAVGTIILAAATVWLGFKTRDLAQSAQASLALEATPYLALQEVVGAFEPKTHTANVAIVLNNPGRVMVSYRVTEFVVTLGGQAPNPPKLPSVKVPVYPGDQKTYYSDRIFGVPTPPPNVEGVARVKLEYWGASGTAPHTVQLDLTLELVPLPDGNFRLDWRYASDPVIT